MRLFTKHKSTPPELTPAAVPPKEAATELPKELLWLLDAPLFIDEPQVEALYDAVLRPDYEETTATLSTSISNETTLGASTTVGAALPWFAKAEAELEAKRTHSAGRGQDITLTRISNSYRHLLALSLHYASQEHANSPAESTISAKRFVVASQSRTGDILTSEEAWLNQTYVEMAPRALVFLDIPPRSALIPAALELTNGEVKVLAETLGAALGGQVAPSYPGSTADPAEENNYFEWFASKFEDRAAVKIVEGAVRDRQISWIDYNVSLAGGRAPFMHLHLVGHGHYDTGVFAYNFVVRGFKHGLRIVGTLKSGPDLNVLAVFER